MTMRDALFHIFGYLMTRIIASFVSSSTLFAEVPQSHADEQKVVSYLRSYRHV